MTKYVEIEGVRIGEGFPPYIVAEISANHNGSIKKAMETITQAKLAGANAVKLQSYTADTMTLNCDRQDFKIEGGLWGGQTLFDLYQSAHTPFEWHESLFKHAKEIGLTCFSTPFDDTAVDLLEELDVVAYKIASFELTDLALIKTVARTQKPIILSTGMANYEEISEAISIVRSFGNENIILLHCISAYPAPYKSMNLRTIQALSKDFDVVVGLSDHSLGVTASQVAISLGGCFIEKHFILDRKDGGPDSSFSIEPKELRLLCEGAVKSWQCLGEAGYQLREIEKENLKYRRSLYAAKDIAEGDVLSLENVRKVRPGYGLAPKYLDLVLGRKATCNIEFGEALQWNMIDE